MENGKLSEIGSNNIPLPICIIDENGKVIEKATRIGEVFLSGFAPKLGRSLF